MCHLNNSHVHTVVSFLFTLRASGHSFEPKAIQDPDQGPSEGTGESAPWLQCEDVGDTTMLSLGQRVELTELEGR